MIVQNKVTVRDHGEGYTEASWGASYPTKRRCAARGKSKDREANIIRSNRQAQAKVRRYVWRQN